MDDINIAGSADRERWNAIYRGRSHTSLEPDAAFLRMYREYVEHAIAHKGERRALELAAGPGRNALWLAHEGWRVTLNDLSDEAVHLAEANARKAHLALTLRRESAQETLAWSADEGICYDLILMLFFLERSLFPLLREVLAPGGMLLVKTRTEDHPRFAGGSAHPEYFLRRGELLDSFRDLHVLHTAEESGMAELLVQA